MELTEEQKQHVARWIAEGAKLADVQRRLDEELGTRLTYMQTRFLIDDLQLTPLDPPEPAPPAPPAAPESVTDPLEVDAGPSLIEGPAAGAVNVQVKVDDLTRPGSMVSGSVVFSDGGKAAWYLDQTGRLGMAAELPGYRPPEPDIAEFQLALERELAKMGI